MIAESISVMKKRRCETKECGAVVLLLPVEGREIAVDPAPVEVVVSGRDNQYRLAIGYRPHRNSCVDIAGRLSSLEG